MIGAVREGISMIFVIAKIDPSARARLSWIQSFAASFGIVPKPISGHITLGTLDGEREKAIAVCKNALAAQQAFTVDFLSVEVLGQKKAIAATAAREGALEALRENLALGADWSPHIVLLEDQMMDLNWIRSAMAQMFEPFTARVERIEFMEEGRIIDAFDLKGEAV